ncbi:chromosome partitioning protein ParB [Legionella rubrilucens]|uniref:Probable chromosome-partitioning protein ParB n=1 Tax=Legionella rubrilucens TaxID=458 RepID=A0A0W0XR72_9GAMM|nr:ParB/RepB/Spo0J family partition protein [Legionella rubrilucens]KTD46832.1 chromosome partitioning protein ParB [Legionella rubrilucens]
MQTPAQYQLLPLDALQPGRYQPRIHFEETALQELAQSITAQGLIEPLVVRAIAAGRYEIIAGERRWRAAKLAGLSEIPCLIGQYTDQQAAALTLVENIQRQELNLIEEATGYRRLCDEFHFQQDEIAVLVGKSRSHIANILRLLTLTKSVQDKIGSGALSLGHARNLVGMTPFEQMRWADDIINGQWSVRQLEEKVRQTKAVPAPLTDRRRDRDIERLQSQLAEQVGAPVQIVNDDGSGGWLQIKFFDNDTLAGLLERMGLRYD